MSLFPVSSEVHVFFFFFSPGHSPAYEDPLFIRFCEACDAVRKLFPTITVSSCRTLLSVVAHGTEDGISYQDVAKLAGLDYIQAVHHVEMLSSGRAGLEGLGLLIRQNAESKKFRKVTLSKEGRELARHFLLGQDDSVSRSDIASQIGCGPLPAFHLITQKVPGLSLGTLTVLLHVALQQKAFGIDGQTAKAFADDLDISNIPRHLAILGEGLRNRSGHGLINMVMNDADRRVKLPELTAKGHRVLAEIASAVSGKPVTKPQKAKPEILTALESPSDMDDLTDDDFLPIIWDEDAKNT